VSPDGSVIASGSQDKTIHLWRLHTAKCIQVIEGHEFTVASVAFSVDGRHLASGDDRWMRVWDLSSSSCIKIVKGLNGVVTSLTYSADGRMFAVSGHRNTRIFIFDVITYKYANNLTGHTDWITSVAFTSDGSMIISGSCDGTIRAWDTTSIVQVQVWEGQSDIFSVAVSPENDRIVNGSIEGSVQIWELPPSKGFIVYLFSFDGYFLHCFRITCFQKG
jgi:WD40 repeat protein